MKNQDSHVQLFIENKLSRISAALIKRINFPKVLAGKMTRHASQKAKLRPMLSEHDQAEVRQICRLPRRRARRATQAGARVSHPYVRMEF